MMRALLTKMRAATSPLSTACRLPEPACPRPHLRCPIQQTRPSSLLPHAAAADTGRDTSPTSSTPGSKSEGVRFVYEPPLKKLSFRTWRQRRALAQSKEVQAKVDIMVEGMPLRGKMNKQQQNQFLQEVGMDAGLLIKRVLALRAEKQPNYKPPRVATLSVVVCDDARIAVLNAQHRGKDGPTDVLSFEMDDELDFKVSLPVKLLGDLIISLDTADRQAKERGHTLRDEVRILMVHGMLHLCGYDHERGHQELLEMAAAEQRIMQELGWVGEGLISAVGADKDDVSATMHDAPKAKGFGGGTTRQNKKAVGAVTVGPSVEGAMVEAGGAASPWRKRPAVGADAAVGGSAAGEPVRRAARGAAAGGGGGTLGVLGAVFGSSEPEDSDVTESPAQSGDDQHSSASHAGPDSRSSTRSAATTEAVSAPGSTAVRRSRPKVRLVALDMDGTLLDSRSKVRDSSVEAIREACGRGVSVILATGKARPAAIRACQSVGLAGPGLLVHSKGPGIFLQGLAVHGREGRQLADAQLPRHVVEEAFRYVEERGASGGVSLVAFTGDHCTTLRMTDDLRALHEVYYEPLADVASSLEELLSGPPVRKLLFMTTPQVVDGVLKPHWSKVLHGSGAAPMQAVPNMLEIVPSGVDKWQGAQVLLRDLGVSREEFMAVGDGSNDLQLVANAGVGVAMGNAVPAVKAAAAAVVSSHDEDGIAEAFERFVL